MTRRWTNDDAEYMRALDEDIERARKRMGCPATVIDDDEEHAIGELYAERDRLRAVASLTDRAAIHVTHTGGGESTMRVAGNWAEAANEVRDRVVGAPKAVRQGNRLVPVAYDVTITPLVSDDEYARRESAATMAASPRNVPYQDRVTVGAMRMYTNAQQSDDGIGTAFMTPNERRLASMEWSKQLRIKVKASDDARKQAERSRVLVDIQDLD